MTKSPPVLVLCPSGIGHVHFKTSPREADIKLPPSLSLSADSIISIAGNSALIHPHHNHGIEFEPFCAVQSKEI